MGRWKTSGYDVPGPLSIIGTNVYQAEVRTIFQELEAMKAIVHQQRLYLVQHPEETERCGGS
jgi:hypothetical protein